MNCLSGVLVGVESRVIVYSGVRMGMSFEADIEPAMRR